VEIDIKNWRMTCPEVPLETLLQGEPVTLRSIALATKRVQYL